MLSDLLIYMKTQFFDMREREIRLFNQSLDCTIDLVKNLKSEF